MTTSAKDSLEKIFQAINSLLRLSLPMDTILVTDDFFGIYRKTPDGLEYLTHNKDAAFLIQAFNYFTYGKEMKK